MRVKGAQTAGVLTAVTVCAALDLMVGTRPSLSPVSEEAMKRALTVLEANHQPGTLIVHSPLFGLQELKALGALRARSDLPDAAVRARRRVLVLDRREQPMGGLGRPHRRVPVDESLVVDVYEPPETGSGRRAVFDLLNAIGPDMLHVERPPGRVVTRCDEPRPDGGFQCPGQPGWLYVAPVRVRIDGTEQHCVWAHPTQGGTMVFSFAVPEEPSPGYRLVLELAGALTDDAVRQTSGGAPVRAEVRQGGRLLRQLVRSNHAGWARTSVVLSPALPVRLEVSAKRDGRRHFCLEARVFEAER